MNYRALLILLLVLPATACITSKPISKRPGTDAVVLSGVPVRQWGDNTCGAGALSTVLNYFRVPATEDDLNANLKKGRHGGVVSVDLLLEARRRGVDAKLVRGTPEMVKEAIRAGSPPILMLRVLDAPGVGQDLFHYIVVDGYDSAKELARMQFGDGRIRWASLERSSHLPIGSGIKRAWEGTDFATLIVQPGVAEKPAAEELRRAVLLEESGRFSEARDVYREYVTAHPDSSVAFTNLGNVEAQLGNVVEAEKAYRTALRRDPMNRDALNNLAWLLLQQRRFDEARENAERATKIAGPDTYLVLDTLAQIQVADDRCDEAMGTYRRAIEDVPLSRPSARASMLYGLGLAQSKCDRAADARATFESALQSSPDSVTEAAIRNELTKLR